MLRQLENLRNLGIIAHIDAGKTTVTERMLFYSGSKHRMGFVDKGTTETDSDPEEQERGITIYSACVTFTWQQTHINLLDTPGHVDFTAEVERCLRVLDGAAVVFSAREGVEAQSETVWRQANRYQVPRLAFINKMDREGADFEGVHQQMIDRLGANPLVLQIPVGAGPRHIDDPFRGVVDLLHMQMLSFDPDTDGQQIDDLEAELIDRFGPLVSEVEGLFYTIRLKVESKNSGIVSLVAKGNIVVVELTESLGGGREALKKILGPDVDIGDRRIYLSPKSLGDDWHQVLLRVVRDIKSFNRKMVMMMGDLY